MKKNKLILLVAILFLSLTLFASCRSNKKPCPAYDKLKIENIKFFN